MITKSKPHGMSKKGDFCLNRWFVKTMNDLIEAEIFELLYYDQIELQKAEMIGEDLK